MTMIRRPVDRDRRLAILAALVMLVACVLPWWQLGGGDGIPPLSGNAFESSGIVVFVVALATLAVVTLPYAASDRRLAIDRWPTFALLATAGWLGWGIRVVDLAMSGALSVRQPEHLVTNGPGLWLAAIGLALLSRAAFDIAREPPAR